MAKRINREEIKAEVKRRQQNAARDYAEKANRSKQFHIERTFSDR